MRGNSSQRRGGFRRILRVAALSLASAPLLYLLAAIVGSLVPRNSDWREPSHGVVVFVRNNGVHADLILPASAAGINLYYLVPPGHIADRRAARGWVAFGWGQREFYLETPGWWDLTVCNATRAVFGGDALMHIQHLGRPRPSSSTRSLRLSRREYHQLAAAVAGGFAMSGGRTIPLHGRGYGRDDVFYEANGRYDALRTSNQWTADALAQGGVRIGVWTPLVQGIMWRFRQSER